MRRCSLSGRLARPINKLTSPFRWMGSKVAVYDLRSPSESGAQVRKNPSHLRGKNRRGCRSRRGGKKRRAMAGAAPETSTPAPSERRITGNCRRRRLQRKVDYSRTLIGVFVDQSKKLDIVRSRLRSMSNTAHLDVDAYTKRVNNLRGLINKTRRSWLELAKTSGDSPAFCYIRFRLLVDERNKSFDWDRPFVVKPDWYGELPPPPGQPEWKQRIVTTRKFRVCMHCGQKVTTSVCACESKNRPVVAKAPPVVKSARATSSRTVSENKPGQKKLFKCPSCNREFEYADGHSAKKCALRKSRR